MAASAIILAAGHGRRMKSDIPKGLHKIAGLSMVEHVVRTVKEAGIEQTYLVLGHQKNKVHQAVPHIDYVVQEEQLGTGHAVNQCCGVLADSCGPILVTCVDTPLFTASTMLEVLKIYTQEQAAAVVITAEVIDPTGYGRVIRNERGLLNRIVEQKDASACEHNIKEINTGTYCFNSKLLFKYLSRITSNNAQGEYQLPDVIPLMIKDGYPVAVFCLQDATEALGVNDRVQLAHAEKIMQERICRFHMQNGVTIINPEQTYIELDCEIGQDTVIYPNTFIQKKTKIGSNCAIGPNVRLETAVVENQVTIEQVVIVKSKVDKGAAIGPYVYLRPAAARKTTSGDKRTEKNGGRSSDSKSL